MPTDSETCLFGILPEQMSTARPVGAPRLRKAERRQVSLRPLSLEDLLPPDHRARFVWSFAEGLDLSALYRAIKAVEGHPGHPPADPRILLALWLYATVEGVGSARELDRLCREHIGFEWLCGGGCGKHTAPARVPGGPGAGGGRCRLVPPPCFAGALPRRGDGRNRPAKGRARGRSRNPEPAQSCMPH